MNKERVKELDFLLRTKTPIAVIESRSGALCASGLYEDYYTLSELIEAGLIQYIGRKNEDIYLRPIEDFYVYVIDDIRRLMPGEIITLSLGEEGVREFNDWIEKQ